MRCTCDARPQHVRWTSAPTYSLARRARVQTRTLLAPGAPRTSQRQGLRCVRLMGYQAFPGAAPARRKPEPLHPADSLARRAWRRCSAAVPSEPAPACSQASFGLPEDAPAVRLRDPRLPRCSSLFSASLFSGVLWTSDGRPQHVRRNSGGTPAEFQRNSGGTPAEVQRKSQVTVPAVGGTVLGTLGRTLAGTVWQSSSSSSSSSS